MYYYKLYGMRVVSDFELLQLINLSEKERMLPPQITILERKFPEEYKRSEECYVDVGKERSIFSNSYCYMLMERGEAIYYEKKESSTEELLNAFLLGWGISVLFYQKDRLAIHCSCVQKDGEAILISGDSGSGKSTATSELLKHGYSLVADDIAVVRPFGEKGLLVAPAFPYQKICRDALPEDMWSSDRVVYIDENRDKFLVPYQGSFSEEEVLVRAMYILEIFPGEKAELKELAGGEKFRACMNSLFIKPLLGEKLYAPENGSRVLEFASRLPVYRIKRPVGKDTKMEVVDFINCQ